MEYGFSIRDRIETNIPVHLIKAMGGNWIRLNIRWSSVEYHRPDYLNSNVQEDRYDDIVECCRDLGINILAVLDDVPAWALDYNFVFPSNVTDWKRFVSRIVRRYRDTIKHWMLWESINHDVIHTKMNRYIDDIFRPGVEAIWEQDMTAKIVSPDIDISKEGWVDWLRKFVRCSYLIDYLGFQIYAPSVDKLKRIVEYGKGNRFTNSFRKIWDLDGRPLHEILNHFHFSDTPIWLTHTGWDARKVSRIGQMKLYQQMIEYLESEDSPFKLTIFDSLVDGFYCGEELGLFDAHYRAKPSSLWMIQRMGKRYEPYCQCQGKIKRASNIIC